MPARATRSEWAASSRCTPTTAKTSMSSTPATSWRPSASKTSAPATRSEPSVSPIVLEEMTFPAPVIDVAVEPKSKQDQEKLSKALMSLSDEDPTFKVHTDEDTGQTICPAWVSCISRCLVDRMLREFKVDAAVGKPQVAYRETLTKPVIKHTYTHKKQTGGSGQFAEVQIDVTPAAAGDGYEFTDNIKGGRIPKEYIPAVDAGPRMR